MYSRKRGYILPSAKVFALGTPCKNCNWYPYLMFTKTELKLLGTQKILRETWDAKVHVRSWWVNSKEFWRWRITLGCVGLRWLGLVVSNGPNCVGDSVSIHLRAETYPVSETLCYPENSRWLRKSRNSTLSERVTNLYLAKAELDTTDTGKKLCLWATSSVHFLQNMTAWNWNPCFNYVVCQNHVIYEVSPLSPRPGASSGCSICINRLLSDRAQFHGVSISRLNNHTRWFDQGDRRVMRTVLTTFRAM
jgi:hypothetical protein